MSGFYEAFRFVLDHEGGYVNNPDDPGGETMYGISKRSYPHLNIKNLSRQQACEIYRKDFWDKLQLDDLPSRVAFVLFDTAVNCGTGRAVKLLQESLNALGGTPALECDGALGPRTREAVSQANEKELVREFILQRQKYYREKVRENPKKTKFFAGWILRTLDLSDAVAFDQQDLVF